MLGDSSTFEIYRDSAHFADVKTVATGNLLEGFDIVLRGDAAAEPAACTRRCVRARLRHYQARQGSAGAQAWDQWVQVDTEAAKTTAARAAVLAICAMADLRARAASKHN